MSRAFNRRKKERRRALFAAMPELKDVYNLIRRGRVPRWTLAKLPNGTVRMRRAGYDGKLMKRYVHPWCIHSTLGLEARRIMFQMMQEAKKQGAKP